MLLWSCLIAPLFDYPFPIDLAPIGIPIGAKSKTNPTDYYPWNKSDRLLIIHGTNPIDNIYGTNPINYYLWNKSDRLLIIYETNPIDLWKESYRLLITFETNLIDY